MNLLPFICFLNDNMLTMSRKVTSKTIYLDIFPQSQRCKCSRLNLPAPMNTIIIVFNKGHNLKKGPQLANETTEDGRPATSQPLNTVWKPGLQFRKKENQFGWWKLPEMFLWNHNGAVTTFKVEKDRWNVPLEPHSQSLKCSFAWEKKQQKKVSRKLKTRWSQLL